jgi:hypothetical protein
MTRNSLEHGETQPRTVRIPEGLWSRLESWATGHDLGNSEALRELLSAGLNSPPPVVIRAPLAWMIKSQSVKRGHRCSRLGRWVRDECSGDLQCEWAWKFYPEEWFLARIPSGSDWWYLDDVLRAAVREDGAVIPKGTNQLWRAVHYTALADVRSVFQERPDRLRLHALTPAVPVPHDTPKG